MSDNRVAKRYAKSLLDLAKEKGVLDAVHDDMQALNQVVKENRNLLLALKNPVLKQDKKKKILAAIFPDAQDMTKAIFDIINRKNRANVLPEIAVEFHKQYNVFRGIQVAQITTATPLNDELREQFISLIKEISEKDTIQLQEKINHDIIGGYVLTVGDKQIDDSIKSKLNHLRRDLTQNQYVKEI